MPAEGRILFFTDYLLTPQKRISDSGILVNASESSGAAEYTPKYVRVLALGNKSAFSADQGLSIIRLAGTYAVPGLKDFHIHGAGGFDVNNILEVPDGLDKMSRYLATKGITSFMPTFKSSPKEKLLKMVDAIVAVMNKKNVCGATPLGINIEGPFLNPKYSLSHGSENICPIDMGFAKELFQTGKRNIRFMTFAPELEHSAELVEEMFNNNIIPSMGHSDAKGDDVRRAIDSGVFHCTHIFNSMPQLHQREYNLTIAALTNDNIFVEVIADGVHLQPEFLKLVCKMKPADRIIGISNMSDEHTAECKKNIKVSPHGKGMLYSDNHLSGTTIPLWDGWRNLIETSGLSEENATACVALNQAAEIGKESVCGITPGKNADIAFFSVDKHEPVLTLINGKIIYAKMSFFDAETQKALKKHITPDTIPEEGAKI